MCPTHDFKCKKGHIFERTVMLSELDNIQVCECGEDSVKIFLQAPSFTIKQFEAYESPTTGEVISNYKKREEDLRASGCEEYDPGIKQDSARKLKEEEAALDKMVDDTVEQTFEAMPTVKKEKLENELKNSTLEYARGDGTPLS